MPLRGVGAGGGVLKNLMEPRGVLRKISEYGRLLGFLPPLELPPRP